MIRRRLVIGVTCTVAVAILLGSWLMVTSLQSRLVANVDDSFTNGAVNLDLRDQLLDRGPAIDRLDRRRTALVRYDADGDVVASVPSGSVDDPDPLPDGPAEPTRAIFTIASSGDGPRYRAVTIPNRDGGQTLVGVSLAEVDETVAEARRIQLLVGLAAIGVVGVLCLLQIRRAFSPIDGMIASAGRIADGDLTERTTVDEPDSEVGRLATALNRMLDRIESAVDEKTQSEERMRRFVADASHDLRTPLTSVRGYADLYRQGATDPESVARGMDRIEAEATRMSRLVDDLMVLARLDQRPARAETPVDIGRVVGEAVDAARVVDTDRTYDLDLPTESTAVVAGDADQLRQVLDNLLANGRRHTPEGTTIATAVRSTDDAVVVDVVDDGPGFRPEDRTRAFDRFWRATRSDENPLDGSGLGLSIVHSIVEAHGGSVTLDDSPAGGAHFSLRFPTHQPPSPDTPPGAPTT
ncbi:sensor histidine kinase [Actinospongicola halichondriae]|uniref:sensor histidine kinase n=1 Tax=Actinospongicola halichondriae TaxID=3236844 RepID=UPI003D376D69